MSCCVPYTYPGPSLFPFFLVGGRPDLQHLGFFSPCCRGDVSVRVLSCSSFSCVSLMTLLCAFPWTWSPHEGGVLLVRSLKFRVAFTIDGLLDTGCSMAWRVRYVRGVGVGVVSWWKRSIPASQPTGVVSFVL